MKNQKGLTLPGTIVLVLLIAFIVFGVIYFIRIQTAKEGLEDLKTDLLLVQAKVRKLSADYTLEKNEEVLVGTKLTDMQEDETIKEFLNNNSIDINEKKKKYYVLNQDNLNELELSKIKLEPNSYYIVEYTEGEVYYTKGFEYIDGNNYYDMNNIESLKLEQ